MTRTARGRRRAAFTLIETLAVIGILTLLIALATPSLLSAVKASRLTAAGDLVSGKLAEAQGLALTFSADVELRFYKAPPVPPADGSSGQYLQLLQLVETADDAAAGEEAADVARFQPIGSREPLPDGVAISSHAEFTSLWNLPVRTESQTDGTEREYVAVRFRPDGGTDLAETGLWHLTLVEQAGTDPTRLPPNFCTLQIDPVTARVGTYRPE